MDVDHKGDTSMTFMISSNPGPRQCDLDRLFPVRALSVLGRPERHVLRRSRRFLDFGREHMANTAAVVFLLSLGLRQQRGQAGPSYVDDIDNVVLADPDAYTRRVV